MWLLNMNERKKWASSHTPPPSLLDNALHNERKGYALNT